MQFHQEYSVSIFIVLSKHGVLCLRNRSVVLVSSSYPHFRRFQLAYNAHWITNDKQKALWCRNITLHQKASLYRKKQDTSRKHIAAAFALHRKACAQSAAIAFLRTLPKRTCLLLPEPLTLFARMANLIWAPCTAYHSPAPTTHFARFCRVPQ